MTTAAYEKVRDYLAKNPGVGITKACRACKVTLSTYYHQKGKAEGKV